LKKKHFKHHNLFRFSKFDLEEVSLNIDLYIKDVPMLLIFSSFKAAIRLAELLLH
jgi:hypothetical protein